MDNKNSLINFSCKLNIYEGEIIKNHIMENNFKNTTIISSSTVIPEPEKKITYEIRRAK